MDAIHPKSQFIGFPTKKWSVNVDPKFGCSASPGLQDSAIATDHQGDHHILRHAALFVLADIESPNVVPAKTCTVAKSNQTRRYQAAENGRHGVPHLGCQR